MGKRLRKFRRRLKSAGSNLRPLLAGGWRRIAPSDRKAIGRAVSAILFVVLLGAAGLWLLSSKVKRPFTATLTCGELHIPFPFHTDIQKGAQILTLWNHVGSMGNLNLGSIQPSPSPKLGQKLGELNFESGASQPYLRIEPKPLQPADRGLLVEISSPAATMLTISGEDLSPTASDEEKRIRPLNIRLESEEGGASDITCQVEIDKRDEVEESGLRVPELKDNSDAKNTFTAAPFPDSAIELSFHSERREAISLINLDRSGVIDFSADESNAPVAVLLRKCGESEITLGGSARSFKDTDKVRFEQATVTNLGAELAKESQTPGLTVKLSGEIREAFFDDNVVSLTRLGEILSKDLTGQTIFGLVIISIIFVLGKLLDRAVEVLGGIVIPSPEGPSAENNPPNTGGTNHVLPGSSVASPAGRGDSHSHTADINGPDSRTQSDEATTSRITEARRDDAEPH